MELEFWKYEGAGNDFIMLDGRQTLPEFSAAGIAALCNRHRGIGADGLIVLLPEKGYDFRMRYFNADGGEVSMCGNGGRCLALFAHHLGIGGQEKRFIGTDGPHTARICSSTGDEGVVELGMIDVESYEFGDRSFFLNTGVPHYVEFVPDVAAVDVENRGREIRYAERFAAGGGTNANFAQIEGHGQIRVRTYERGVEGETLACGTGAVACAIATHLYTQSDCCEFQVEVPGGTLQVRFHSDDNQHFRQILLGGPARRIFRGIITTKYLIGE